MDLAGFLLIAMNTVLFPDKPSKTPACHAPTWKWSLTSEMEAKTKVRSLWYAHTEVAVNPFGFSILCVVLPDWGSAHPLVELGKAQSWTYTHQEESEAEDDYSAAGAVHCTFVAWLHWSEGFYHGFTILELQGGECWELCSEKHIHSMLKSPCSLISHDR